MRTVWALPLLGASAIIRSWAAKPVLLCLLLLRLPGRVERPSCLVWVEISGVSGSWALVYSRRPAAVLAPSWAFQGMKKGRRPRRRPHLKLFDRMGPARGPVPVESAPFPAEIAGFLMLSRAVPVYPGFSNILSPYKEEQDIKRMGEELAARCEEN